MIPLALPGGRRFSSSFLTHSPRKVLASKRHLEYDGDDGASVYARQREALDRRAQAAMQAATDYLMPQVTHKAREARAKARLRSSMRGRDYLVESAIQHAFANGELDNLQGRGRPLLPVCLASAATAAPLGH